MSADPFKLEVWIRSQIARGADAFSLALVARLDQGDQLSAVDDWPAPAPTETAAFVANVQEQAQADASAFPGRVCTYVLAASRAGRPAASRRFTARGADAAVFGGMSEPPTANGVLAQMMRHLEAERRLTIESKISALDDMREVLRMAVQALKDTQADAAALRAREVETIGLWARMQAGSQQFELERAKLQADQAQSAEARQKFWAIATPVLVSKLGGGVPVLPAGNLPGNASPGAPGDASAPASEAPIDPTALDLMGALAAAQVPLDALVASAPADVQRAVHSYVQKYGPALRARLQPSPSPSPSPEPKEQPTCSAPSESHRPA